MEVNENRGRLCRKNFRGKSVKKESPKGKRHHRSVKRANHNKGSMNVSDPMVLVPPGGNSHSSRFARLCVRLLHSWGRLTHSAFTFRFRQKGTAQKEKSSENP